MALPPDFWRSEQMLNIFRTKPCQRMTHSGICEWRSQCQYSHCLDQPRRAPNKNRYSPELCPHVRYVVGANGEGHVECNCPHGTRCPNAHSKEEVLYHPLIFKTHLCEEHTKLQRAAGVIRGNTRPRCHRYYCPFAHSPQELRSSSLSPEDRMRLLNLLDTLPGDDCCNVCMPHRTQGKSAPPKDAPQETSKPQFTSNGARTGSNFRQAAPGPAMASDNQESGQFHMMADSHLPTSSLPIMSWNQAEEGEGYFNLSNITGDVMPASPMGSGTQTPELQVMHPNSHGSPLLNSPQALMPFLMQSGGLQLMPMAGCGGCGVMGGPMPMMGVGGIPQQGGDVNGAKMQGMGCGMNGKMVGAYGSDESADFGLDREREGRMQRSGDWRPDGQASGAMCMMPMSTCAAMNHARNLAMPMMMGGYHCFTGPAQGSFMWSGVNGMMTPMMCNMGQQVQGESGMDTGMSQVPYGLQGFQQESALMPQEAQAPVTPNTQGQKASLQQAATPQKLPNTRLHQIQHLGRTGENCAINGFESPSKKGGVRRRNGANSPDSPELLKIADHQGVEAMYSQPVPAA